MSEFNEHLEKAGAITSEYNSHSISTFREKSSLEVGKNTVRRERSECLSVPSDQTLIQSPLILDYLRKPFEVNCAHLLKLYKDAADNFLSYK